MVLSLLVRELWLLVDTQAPGKFEHRIESLFNVKVLVVIPYVQLYFSDATSEVWEFGDENNKVISPSLPYRKYFYGIALFPVNADFCKK